MQTHGVVCFRGVATESDLRRGEDLFWQWLTTVHPSIKRDDPSTHTSSVWNTLGYRNSGVMAQESIGQSEFMWHCRLLPKVRGAFATLWGLPCPQPADSTALITSFDGCGSWRNAWLRGADRSWQTDGNWFHLDQNHKVNPGLHTVQSLLNFYPTTHGSGSTVLVPGSHRDFGRMCRHAKSWGSFIPVGGDPDDALYCRERARMAMLGAGDLLCWRSEVVHCSSGVARFAPQRPVAVADALPGREHEPLARLVAYISMLPRTRLAACKDRDRRAAARREAVREGRGSGHDALVVRKKNRPSPVERRFVPPPEHPCWRLV